MQTYKDKAEVTREYYRKQGENRERQRILNELQKIEQKTPGAQWSPRYLMKVIEAL